MANRERGEMRLATSDGTEYTLKLTTNAACELEDRTGKTLDELMAESQTGKVRPVRWILWASLQEFHRDTVKTPEDVGPIIDRAGGLVGIVMQLSKFMALNADDSGESPGDSARPPSAEAASGDAFTSTPVSSASRPNGSGNSHSSSSGESLPPHGRNKRRTTSETSLSPGS